MNLTLIVFVCYIGGIFFIAIRAFQVTRDPAGFLLANRELASWRAALSAGASDMSGWLLLGLPGLAFVAHTQAIWMALGLAAGTWLNWKFIAAPLREKSIAHNDALTLPTFFADRFPDQATALRIVTALTILVFYTIYLAAGMVAAAKLFVAIFDLAYLAALSLGAVIVISYTMLGGFRAVVNTDALQALMMIGALVATNLILLQATNDASRTIGQASIVDGDDLSIIAIISALAWGLGYPGQPHILARFMATRTSLEIDRARQIAVAWTLVCLCSAVAIGYLASHHPVLGHYSGDAEKIFIVASELVFHPLIAGMIIAAILAAIMSTADSQLLIAASALYYDLFSQSADTQSPRAWLRGIRLITGVLGLVSVIFAFNPQSTVLGLVAYAWAGFGASFGPAVILSVFSTRIRGNAVILGMLSGAATVVLWEAQTIIFANLYSLIPGFIANLLVVSIVTLFNRNPSKPDFY